METRLAAFSNPATSIKPSATPQLHSKHKVNSESLRIDLSIDVLLMSLMSGKQPVVVQFSAIVSDQAVNAMHGSWESDLVLCLFYMFFLASQKKCQV